MRRFMSSTLVAASFLAAPASGLGQTQPTTDQVPLPAGMPRLPPGMPAVPVVRRPPPGRPPPGQSPPSQEGKAPGPARQSPANTYEIYGDSDVPRFAVVGAEPNLPEFHVVRKGDTLWDICATYFHDPWRWPKLWALNPQITNPHWIYPGDRIRLREPSQQRAQARVRRAPQFGELALHRERGGGEIYLRRTAFVEEGKLRGLGKVVGANSARIMLTNGDVVYIRTTRKHPLAVGETYSVFKADRTIRHPYNGRKVGRLVRLAADVTITNLTWKGRRGIARGVLSRSIDPVERGFFVAKVRRRFQRVAPVANRKVRSLESVIVAILGEEEIIGAGTLVVLDKGRRDGLRPGFVLDVLRRGDQYLRTMQTKQARGPRHWPAERIGVLVVAAVGEHHAVAVVEDSIKELREGDLAQLRYEAPPRAR